MALSDRDHGPSPSLGSRATPRAFDQLFPLVYDRLRQLAHQRLRSEPDGSLNTTALVHEAYLKLVDSPGVSCVIAGTFSAWYPGSCDICWWTMPGPESRQTGPGR